jgi:type III secretion protein L
MDMDIPSMEQHADTRFAVNHTGPGGIQVNRAAQIMTADTHRAFLQAGEMLAQAQYLADETTASAKAGHQAACERGYQEGLERARAQTTRENVQAAAQQRRHLAGLENDISALVLQTLRQILGEIDRTDRVSLLVREALTRLGQSHGEIVLHVHPDLAAEVTDRLSQLRGPYQPGTFRLLTDATLAPDACRVTSGSGTVEGDVQRQLAALESALAIATDSAGVDGTAAANGVDNTGDAAAPESEVPSC